MLFFRNLGHLRRKCTRVYGPNSKTRLGPKRSWATHILHINLIIYDRHKINIMPATKRLMSRANRDAKRRRTQTFYYKPESKFHNTTVSHLTTPFSNTNLCNIAAGTGTQDRIGRKVRVKSAEYTLCTSGSATDVPIRAILYVPKSTGDNLSLAIFTDPVPNDRFWVIHDCLYDANGGGGTTSAQYRHSFNLPISVEYDGPLAGDLSKNDIKLFIATGNSSGNVIGHTKVWYIDN